MPDIGDLRTATLTVSPSGVDTVGVLTVYAPDGTPITPSVSGNGTGTLTASVTYTAAGWWLLNWVVTGTGAGTEFERVFVPVTPTQGTAPAYAGLDELKRRLRIENNTDDDELTDALDAGARDIDQDTGRRFYADTATSARIYEIAHRTTLLVDDICTATGLIVEVGNGTTWTAVDSSLYRLTPQNNLADGKAAYAIERVNSCWPVGWLARSTARWGWPTIPSPIKQANLLRSQRLFRRKDSPEGVAGFNDLGVIRVARRDPDYEALIAPYIKDTP